MKKQYLIIPIVLIMMFFSTKTSIQAHDLESSSKMGGVLHIEPNDQPRALESTEITIEFNGTNHNDVANNCDCSAKIINSDGTIEFEKNFSELSFPSVNKLSFEFEFRQEGWYKLIAEGLHHDDKFELSYEILVEPSMVAKEVNAVVPTSLPTEPRHMDRLPLYICCLILLVVAVILIYLLRKPKKAKSR